MCLAKLRTTASTASRSTAGGPEPGWGGGAEAAEPCRPSGGGGGGSPTGTEINLTPANDISSVSVNGITLPAPTKGYTSLADAVANATTISKTAFVTGVDGKYTFTVTEGSNASSMVTNVTAFANVASVPAALTSGAADGMTISPVLTVGNVIVVSSASAANTQAAWYVAYVIGQ